MTFRLVPRPPFRLDLTAWVLRRRARNAIDRWDGTTYGRVMPTRGGAVEIRVRQTGPPAAPRLLVTTRGGAPSPRSNRSVVALLEQALGLRVDLAPFYRMASRDRRLAPLARAFRGMKPTRFPTTFEALVNAVACQQLSLTVGLELLNRLAAACARAPTEEDAALPFPRPEDLLRLPPSAVHALGFSQSKTRTLVGLAQRIVDGALDLDGLHDLDNEAAAEHLMSIPGIGRWSAEYVLLRGLGRLDVFPGDDVGARNRLARWLGRRGPLDYEAVRHTVARWQPYAGLVYFHMLLSGLADAGSVRLSRRFPRGILDGWPAWRAPDRGGPGGREPDRRCPTTSRRCLSPPPPPARR